MLIGVYSQPRSGQVWLTRLLADAIGCPTFTWLPQDAGRDIALEGLDRDSPHRVTRAHTISHLNWPRADVLIHIVRDPRDVVVSAACFRYCNIEDPAIQLSAAADEVLASWDAYARDALDLRGHGQTERVEWTTYEALHADPAGEVARLLAFCGLPGDPVGAAERQAFANRRAQIARRTNHSDVEAFLARTDKRHARSGTVGEGRAALPPWVLERVRAETDGELRRACGYYD